MGFDGSLKFDTKVDTSGVENGSRSIKERLRGCADAAEAAGKGISDAFSGQSSKVAGLNSQIVKTIKQMAQLEKECQELSQAPLSSSEMEKWQGKIDAVEQKIREMKAGMAELAAQKLPTAEYEEIMAFITKCETKLRSLIDRQDKMREMGVKESSRQWKSLQYDIDEVTNSIQSAKGELADLENTGGAFQSGKATAGYQAQEEQLEQLNLALDEYKNKYWQAVEAAKAGKEDALTYKNARYQELSNKLSVLNLRLDETKAKGKKAEKAIKKVGDASGAASKKAGRFSKALKMGLRMLAMSMVFRAFTAMMNAAKEGMQNLAQYSPKVNANLSELKSSLTQLKNAFATAFAPILEFITPALSGLISMLSAAAAAVSHFFAVLTGKGTYTRAVKVQEDYADSLKKTGSAAKEAKGQLASFDELEVLNKDNGSGSGASGASPSEMFEEVPVDAGLVSWMDNVKSGMKDILVYVWELKDGFASGFLEGLGDVQPRLESIKASALSIKDSLVGIFTDSSVTAAADQFAKTAALNLGRIAGAGVSIGVTTAQNLLGGIAKYLESSSGTIKNYLVTMFDISSRAAEIAGNFSTAIAYIFEAVGSENGQQLTANLIGIFADAFMGATAFVGGLATDILNAITLPFIENKEGLRAAVEDTLGVIADVAGTVKENLDIAFAGLMEVYQGYIKPFFDGIANGLSEIVGQLVDAYNAYILPVLGELAALFETVMAEHIQPAISSFLALLGNIADFLLVLWETIVQPFVSWIITYIVPVLAKAFGTIGKGALGLFGTIGDVVKGITDAFSGVIEFLTGVFTGDWDMALSGLVKIFEGVRDGIKAVINGILGFIEWMANGIISGINTLIRALNNLSFDLPAFLGGGHVGFSINELSPVSIPRLATGTVVPPRAGEFAAILGDNNREAEVVSPLSTIEQALENVLSRTGAGNSKIVIEASGDMAQFIKQLRFELKKEEKRVGGSILKGAPT